MIDAAVHLWSGDTARYPWAADATLEPPASAAEPDSLFRDLSTAGVSRAVVIQSSAYGDDHRYLLDRVAESSGRLAAVGLVRTRGPAAAADAAALIDTGCVGLRVIVGSDPGWLATPAADGVWTIAEARAVPVGLLVDPPALVAVADLASERPGLAIVLDHLALVSPGDLAQARSPLARLARAPRVSVKVSALRAVGGDAPPFRGLRPVLDTVRELFGYERMIYGTDWPYAVETDPYTSTLDALDAAFVWSDDERARVVESNAAALWWPAG